MDAAETLRALLNEARHKLRDGEPAEAERCAKAVSALVRAERDVAEYAAAMAAQRPDEDEESLRAELLGRLHRLVAADRAGAPVEVLEQLAACVADP